MGGRLVQFALSLFGLTVVALGAAPRPGTFFIYPERVELKDGGFATAERGVLFVPIKRSAPDSRIIGVEFYRFRAPEEIRHSRPPIFRLNGGPGFPGLSRALERKGFYEENIIPNIEVADYIVVGQRGIGSSRPNTVCESTPDFPADRPVDEAEVVNALQETSRKCRTFWESQGWDLSGLNVVEAAADVNDLRKALGYEKITIWGGSFGSHWGMTVMRYHPEAVARAVLTGMEGPDHTYDMPGWVLNSLERIAAEAEQSPELKHLIPEGGLIKALESVIQRLDREPALVTVGKGDKERKVRISGEEVRDVALGYTRRASSRGGIRSWPADVIRLYNGDYTGAARAVIRNRSARSLPTASFFMLDCGSGISRRRHAQLTADPAATIVGRLGAFYDSACPVWESDLGEGFRRNFDTEIPTLIVHGNWDTSTPFENAKELLPHFKKSHFVVVKGGSHGALGEAIDAFESFRQALVKFVATGDMSDLPAEVDLPDVEWVVPEPAEKNK